MYLCDCWSLLTAAVWLVARAGNLGSEEMNSEGDGSRKLF